MMQMLPKIYADFHNLDDENRIRLTTQGTQQDLRRQNLTLTEGMPILAYMDDADDDGNPDPILVNGIAHFSATEKCWVVVVDWNMVYHASNATTSEMNK
jgi:hypothetical protein